MGLTFCSPNTINNIFTLFCFTILVADTNKLEDRFYAAVFGLFYFAVISFIRFQCENA